MLACVDLFHLPSIVGGLLVGLGAATFLLGVSRIAGVSGVLGGLLAGEPDRAVRVAFVAAFVLVGAVAAVVAPELVPARPASIGALVVAGLLVGVGTRLGSGCTSGHGICGVGRLSPRSFAATATFVGVGMLTVLTMRALGVTP